MDDFVKQKALTQKKTFKFSGDHTEVVTIDYDPTKISYSQLLNLFWNNHEYGLTTRVKRQYMSLILYHTEAQKHYAENSIKEERINRAPETIITEIAEAGPFYAAEEYYFVFVFSSSNQFY